MKKNLGTLGLLLIICLVTAIMKPDFLGPFNVENQTRRIGLAGILSVGIAFVIFTGGIDLSIGSVVGLIASLLPLSINRWNWNAPTALFALLVLSACIGLFYGLLITKMRLQPFLVTLCGLLICRGIARAITGDETQGFTGDEFRGLRSFAAGQLPLVGGYAVAYPFLLLLAVAAVAAVVLNWTVFGRYLLALGQNEQAARYSGINTDRMTILAYVLCSTLAGGLGGIMYSLEYNTVQPSNFGNTYELYAIAAAVLGGCSLRGGEGTILGVVMGTAVIPLLLNASNLMGVPTEFDPATLGTVILFGVIADELVKRWAAARRSRKIREK